MAYKPSQRKTMEAEPTEPNLTPIMNLMVVLIPLLLSSAEYVKLGAIELNLPPAAGPLQQEQKLPVEGTKSLDLLVLITNNEFVISCSLPEMVRAMKINRKNNSALFELQQQLSSIKQKIPTYFRKRKTITIQASAGIKYQVVVRVIDAVRMIKRGNSHEELFPDIKLSAGIL